MSQPGIAAQVFPPGEFLKEELTARGWSQADLADILGCSERLTSEVINGKRALSMETARGLGEALGTGPELWLNLENQFQLSRPAPGNKGTIARRARLFEKAPVKELVLRGWIESSGDPDVLEQSLLGFLGIDAVEDEPVIWPHAARKSTSYQEIAPSQLAWLCRARQLAQTMDAPDYHEEALKRVLKNLSTLHQEVEGVCYVPRILLDGGIRFVVVEHLSGTKLDGACFWLDAASPVVVLSLRYDRVDYFWHTLLHELGHLQAKDGLLNDAIPMDSDLLGGAKTEDRPASEKAADAFAVEQLVPQRILRQFIQGARPKYSARAITQFARKLQIHPGIIVGQLQYRGEIPYSHSRRLLEKVRSLVIEKAVTDGWRKAQPPSPRPPLS